MDGSRAVDRVVEPAAHWDSGVHSSTTTVEYTYLAERITTIHVLPLCREHNKHTLSLFNYRLRLHF